MKKAILTALAAAIILPISAHPGHKHDHTSGGYPITPVPFTSVKVESNSFWGQRLEASRVVTIPLAFSKCESEGRYTNFSNAAEHMKDPSKVFKVNGVGYSFDDTDPYKTIEGASYILQTYPDKKLKQYIDSVLNVIASAQEPDGYLYTARTQNPGDPHHWAGDTRWSKVEDLSHEFYNLGHMVEGAVAHYQATGSRKFLDIAIRYADCVIREVGDKPGQACVVPGHQIAEMALAKLYLVTGDKKYLDEAKFFLDYRGKTTITHDYSQAHKPVIEQDEAVGHAVRAAYMYAGMADVAALTGDKDYIKAIDAIWDNIVSKKLYITGGIGATSNGEAFGKNYELPNMSAYCETCAAIGNVYVNYRLFLLHGDSKYYDVLERTLYNGLISGVSLEGNGFFYPNPLESMGQHQRQAWFGCACCPSNICRFIPSLPGYIYAVKDKNVYVNLFLSNKSNLTVGGKKVALSQTTEYPWNGDITVNVDQNAAGQFAMKIRIPGWVRNQVVPSNLYQYTDGKRLGYTVTVNGQTLRPDEVLHFTLNPDPSYPWKGRGLRVSLKDLADNLKQASATEKAFFKSKWKPSLIVKVDALTDEFSSKSGRQKLLESYVESAQVGEPWLIPAEQFGIEQVKPLSLSDLALADNVKVDRTMVAAIFGVPPFVLGVGEFKREAWNNMIQTTVKSIVTGMQQEYTKKLILSPEWYVRFNSLSLLDWDISTIASVYYGAGDRGYVTGNEVRDKLGMSPMDGLDELRVLENYIPYDMAGSQKKLIQEGE